MATAATAGQPVISLTADPGGTSNPIAANDHVAVKRLDGTWHHAVVQSVAGLDVTLTTNVPPGGFAQGAKVVFLGLATDGHAQFTLAAGSTSTYMEGQGSIARSSGRDEPVLFHADNSVAAGMLEQLSAIHSRGLANTR